MVINLSFISPWLIIALTATRVISIQGQVESGADLSGFVPDGAKIGFDCKKEQVPMARSIRKVIIESTVIIKTKIVLITGESSFNLICTRDKSTDSGDVVDVPDQEVDEITDDLVQSTTEATISSTINSTTISTNTEQGKNESTTISYPEEEAVKSDEKVNCEDQNFCVDDNGNIIVNGVNMNKEENATEKSSRFDVTSPIIGAKYGFTCKMIQTPIILGRSAGNNNNKTASFESTFLGDDGESINFVCKRDRSKDSGEINPRLKKSKG